MKSPEFLKQRRNRFVLYGAAALASLGLFHARDTLEEKAMRHERELKDSVAQEAEDPITAEALDQLADNLGQATYGTLADYSDLVGRGILAINAISLTGEAIAALAANRRAPRQQKYTAQPNELGIDGTDWIPPKPWTDVDGRTY